MSATSVQLVFRVPNPLRGKVSVCWASMGSLNDEGDLISNPFEQAGLKAIPFARKAVRLGEQELEANHPTNAGTGARWRSIESRWETTDG